MYSLLEDDILIFKNTINKSYIFIEVRTKFQAARKRCSHFRNSNDRHVSATDVGKRS